MSQIIQTTLPNPNSLTDPQWNTWNTFIAAENINTCQEPVMRRYQCLDEHPRNLLTDTRVNHLLSLTAEGLNSAYANEAEDQCGRSFDQQEMSELKNTLLAFDVVFSTKSYRFNNESVVFKGVSTKPYYTLHRFDSIAIGETVVFHGFLSTSVCREKGKAFAGPQGVLLVINGLDKVDCIVPENSRVKTTSSAHIPEHEVLLNRGTKMVVQKILPGEGQPNQEVFLEVI